MAVVGLGVLVYFKNVSVSEKSVFKKVITRKTIRLRDSFDDCSIPEYEFAIVEGVVLQGILINNVQC